MSGYIIDIQRYIEILCIIIAPWLITEPERTLSQKLGKIMVQKVTNDTPIAMLTVGQLKEVLGANETQPQPAPIQEAKKFCYGIRGIAELFNCSIVTANRIKKSGKIDGAITQIGRKIIVQADLALELAGRKDKGGRK